MQVLKFGGTSVGSAERMKAVADLILNPKGINSPKIIVLSAMAGTTNSLVEISNALFKNKTELAKEVTGLLEEKYNKMVDELFSKKEFKEKGKELNIITFQLNTVIQGG